MGTATGSSISPKSWMDSYLAPAGAYDEFIDQAGKPRSHWQTAAEQFGQIDKTEWQQKQQQLDGLISENGITYNVYQENEANQRPWSMDMLPLVLESKEISKLEAALSQRAHLLNLVLGDVYGRQTLLRSGAMDPYILYANPSFLHPCHGLVSNRQRHIQIYAADIARAPDGNWWVLGDRVEAASGLGYALANRMLMSRLMPKVMQKMDVRSLQPFVNDFTRAIESLSPYRADSPNVALLSPGPSNETYFEQSFLARNLGYTLAEGADLTVRNNQLFMKTIGGVQRVDVLLRRIDSAWSDPLEMRSESMIGVPGLVNAVRQGNLAVANSLGSAFVETTSMLAFLPWFSRNFLGESLEIPSVATWWCGQESEKKFVIENLHRLAVKPTFWGTGAESYFGPTLSSKEKAELVTRINHRPEAFCGQEIVSNATIPVAKGHSLDPRNFQLRVFLVATDNGWRMLPGGLARFSHATDTLSVTMQRGGEAKDTWVIRPPGQSQSQSQTQPKRLPAIVSKNQIRRHASDLPSRSADNLFWLGRYIERAEALARVLQSIWTILVEESSQDNQRVALPFLEQIIPPGGDATDFLSDNGELLNTAKTEEAILDALFNTDNSESLISNFAAIERTASKVKERLSTDTWKRLIAMRDIAMKSQKKDHSVYDGNTVDLLERSLEALAAFIGNLMENTTRTQGWRFLEVGRRIERAVAIASMLRSSFVGHEQDDEILIPKLLAWADSSMTYRRRYLNTYTDVNSFDVICLDYDNPRSLAFQIQQLKEKLAGLPHTQQGERNPIDQTALRLSSQIALVEIPGNSPQVRAKGGQLDIFFAAILKNLDQLALDFGNTYFAHTQPQVEQTAKLNIG